MKNPPAADLPFSDRHDVVRTVCVWKDGTCYRIEIIRRVGHPEEQAYAALLWTEEQHGDRRILVRDVSFSWIHRESAELALEQALETLAAKLKYPSAGETEV